MTTDSEIRRLQRFHQRAMWRRRAPQRHNLAPLVEIVARGGGNAYGRAYNLLLDRLHAPAREALEQLDIQRLRRAVAAQGSCTSHPVQRRSGFVQWASAVRRGDIKQLRHALGHQSTGWHAR